MPILDVMPVSTWRDLRSLIVNTGAPSDEKIASILLGSRKFKSVQSFVHLRAAVEFLFSRVEFPRKRVVFPKYICGSVVRAAERAGMRVTLCDVDRKTGALSADALAQIPLGKFGAVFVVHPFGIPADMKRISSLCKKHNVFLIEDCAHVFDQMAGDKPVGYYGDFVMYHFAKKFANVHGGILISFKTKLPELEKQSHVRFGELFQMTVRMRGLRWPLNLLRSVMPISKDGDEGHDKTFARPMAASGASKRLFMKKFKSFRAGKEARNQVINTYLEFLPGDFKPLIKSLPGDSFHFPVLVPKNKKRDEILKKLRVYSVFADRLWYKSGGFADRLLLLPVTEEMREKDVRMICNLLSHV